MPRRTQNAPMNSQTNEYCSNSADREWLRRNAQLSSSENASSDKEVMVRLYHCETNKLHPDRIRTPVSSGLIYIAKEFLRSAAGLGNAGDGPELEIHFHFIHGVINADYSDFNQEWINVMQAHLDDCGDSELYVGVGLGAAHDCEVRGRTPYR